MLMVPDGDTQCGSQCYSNVTNAIDRRTNPGVNDNNKFNDKFEELIKLEENFIRYWTLWINVASK